MHAKQTIKFANQRLCGLWLSWMGVIILTGTLFGGSYALHPVIFIVGYALGMGILFGSRSVKIRFGDRPFTKSEARIATLSILLMFILMVAFSGRYFATMDFRMIWLGAFLATAIHFIPFSFVYGNGMLILSVPLAALAVYGMQHQDLPFQTIGLLDGAIKLLFGLYWLYKNPLRS
jgi:hypothetical protein